MQLMETCELTDLIREGMEQGICQTDYPEEAAEMTFLYANTVFDDLMEHGEEEKQRKIAAFIYNLEQDSMKAAVIPIFQNSNKYHTTKMGIDRIKRNLKLNTDDVVGYCESLIMNKNCHIYRQGKNWYCEIDNVRLTVNAYSYTIITAHTMK